MSARAYVFMRASLTGPLLKNHAPNGAPRASLAAQIASSGAGTGLFKDRPRRAHAASHNQLTRPGARAEGPTLLAECTPVSTEGPGVCGDAGCSIAPCPHTSTATITGKGGVGARVASKVGIR